MLKQPQVATKKATNVSINSHLLIDAKKLGINLSATLEQALREKVQTAKQRQWARDNKDALAFCNQAVEENGLFSDKYRPFG
ncbi:MAG TPA: acetoacetyl-CoA synthase [Oceanospirillaceae bacterium]|nr:acetoacetyl-CoA synthase [Oceanospirillaceae bacterium]